MPTQAEINGAESAWTGIGVGMSSMLRMNEVFSIGISAEQRYLLPDDTAAIEVIASVAGAQGLGPVLRIPKGADIECCGKGFYYIFREDLPILRKAAAK
jgi:hypothetical protein